MRLVVDTHCWLWMVARPERFSSSVLDLLRDPASELILSAATAWEIAIKHSIGRLELPGRPIDLVSEWMVRTGVTPLPVLHGHALHVADLPAHHADPFDRLLIAQAQMERVPILSADRSFEPYDVEMIAA